MTTLDDYKMPISIRDGLLCMPLRTYADKEQETFPYVILTSDVDWNLTVLDCKRSISNETQFDAQSTFPEESTNKNFDEVGEAFQ